MFIFFLRIRRPPRSTRTGTLFPTRRSSDLAEGDRAQQVAAEQGCHKIGPGEFPGDRVGHRRRLPSGRFEEGAAVDHGAPDRSEEHTSELQSLMRSSYAVFCLKKKKRDIYPHTYNYTHYHTTPYRTTI